MKNDQLRRAIGGIDDDLIEASEVSFSQNAQTAFPRRAQAALRHAVACGALIAALLTTLVFALPQFFTRQAARKDPSSGAQSFTEYGFCSFTSNESGGSEEDTAHETAVSSEDASFQENVEITTEEMQTRAVYISGGPYGGYRRNAALFCGAVGASLGEVRVIEENAPENAPEKTLTAELFVIPGVSPELAVALRMKVPESESAREYYYVFVNPAGQ